MNTSKEPIISIIVPVYNTERFLADCINSILIQTYKDFELILIDDGSSDSSPKICDTFALKDDRIKVFHIKNGGVSRARNVGISVATGKYLMFCDSDDLVNEHWCEYLLHYITDNPNKLVISEWERFQGNEGVPIVINRELNTENMSFYEIFKLRVSGSVCNKIFRSDIVKENGLLFNKEIPVGEDAIFVSEYYSLLVGGCLYIKIPLYFYRQYDDSSIHKYNPLTILYLTKTYYKRALVIEPNYLEKYCNEWLSGLIILLDNVFDKRNTNMNWIEKISLNHKIFKMKEFSFCLKNCSSTAEAPVIMNCLKFRSYFLFYLLQKVISFKNKILARIQNLFIASSTYK